MNTTTQATLENIAQFLYREARFLDDEQWDEWLSCYSPEASFGCLHGMTTIS
jgi:benzoate/toluate 1,2-dioxygenase beta subunit